MTSKLPKSQILNRQGLRLKAKQNKKLKKKKRKRERKKERKKNRPQFRFPNNNMGLQSDCRLFRRSLQDMRSMQ